MRRKSISETDLREIKNHIETTAKDMVKGYTKAQLSLLDGIDTRSVEWSWKYIPVRVDAWLSYYQYKAWKQKKPYSIVRIRVDEIKYLYNKRNKRKKLTEEIKRE